MKEHEVNDDPDREIADILDAIKKKSGYDFKEYSGSFIKRRLLKRVLLSGVSSLAKMKKLILEDPKFFDILLRDLSINVTEMFRDPSFFLALRQEIVPYLRTFPFIRIWTAGCATGEEVYSLAILLKEEGLSNRLRIYATDFNDEALHKAKAGVYPLKNIQKYTINYQKAGGKESLSDYFTADSENIVFHTSLRENIVFSNHNLVTDGIFNEMNLILCRNVMIYFNRELSNKVIGLFEASLCSNGFLCLGSKESLKLSTYLDDFEEVKALNERVYRKITTVEKSTRRKTSSIIKEKKAEPALQDIKRDDLRFESLVIGVSAGGLKALTTILQALSPDFPLSIIIVQHQFPSSSSSLADILARECRLPVKEAEEKEKIRRGTVYIAPPAYHLLIEKDRTFSLALFERVKYARPSVDVLFESAADIYGKNLIGVILTGGNDDGSKGLKMIKEAGGTAIVQDPSTAEAKSMPKSALAATPVDFVLPLELIGIFLNTIAHSVEFG